MATSQPKKRHGHAISIENIKPPYPLSRITLYRLYHEANAWRLKIRAMLSAIFHSFPIQLFLLHFRSNLFITTLWLIVVMLIGGYLMENMGAHFLFLDPEYMSSVGFWSFFLMGLSFAGFMMTWQTTTYILTSYYFPFLASLKRPFAKFCFNNSIIPIGFLSFYLYEIICFQWNVEYQSDSAITVDVLGFLVGVGVGIFLATAYFNFTNKDIFSFLPKDPLNIKEALDKLLTQREELEQRLAENPHFAEHRVDWYINEMGRPRPVRDVKHYSAEVLLRVFRQNHSNALKLQIACIALMVFLGWFMDYEWVRIPAGASIFLFLSLVTSTLGALTYWLHEWRAAFFFVFLIFANFITGTSYFHFDNKVYGLSYQRKVAYERRTLDSLSSWELFQNDKAEGIRTLDNWKARTGEQKPKLVLLCASGGGMRAASWAASVVYAADSVTDGRMMRHTTFMSGASGGMLGLGYLREVYYRNYLKDSTALPFRDKRHFDNISKDLLNGIAFASVVNDMLIPYQGFWYNGQRYLKDRGYMMEQQFIHNTGGIMTKTFAQYREPEQKGIIPMMLLSPVIIDDSRCLLMASSNISYLTRPLQGFKRPGFTEPEGVEFSKLFRRVGADSVRVITGMRMSATYPYILPNVYLPTHPTLQCMDAGFRDNYGVHWAMRYVTVFSDWIRENTSGVVLVQIRDTEKLEMPTEKSREGWVSRLLNPIGTVGTVGPPQDFMQDEALSSVQTLLGNTRLDIVRFAYKPFHKGLRRASLSFHLTSGDKANVAMGIQLPENQNALRRLKKLLE